MKKNTIFSVLCFVLCTFLMTQSLTASLDNGDIILTGYGSFFHPQSTHKRGFNTIPHSAVQLKDNGGGIASVRYIFWDFLGIEASSGIVKNTVKGKKSINNLNIGGTWFSTNALMLQYYFNPCAKCIFHVGSGGHYSMFYDKDCKIKGTKLDITKQNWGLAAEVGMDYMMTECWFFCADIRYLRLKSEVQLTGTVHGNVHLKLNPWIYSAGFGRRF